MSRWLTWSPRGRGWGGAQRGGGGAGELVRAHVMPRLIRAKMMHYVGTDQHNQPPPPHASNPLCIPIVSTSDYKTLSVQASGQMAQSGELKPGKLCQVSNDSPSCWECCARSALVPSCAVIAADMDCCGCWACVWLAAVGWVCIIMLTILGVCSGIPTT